MVLPQTLTLCHFTPTKGLADIDYMYAFFMSDPSASGDLTSQLTHESYLFHDNRSCDVAVR